MKRSTSSRQPAVISRSRAMRLYRMLRLLEQGSISRASLLRKLSVGMRTFYRDLEMLRQWSIPIVAEGHKYSLSGSEPWLERLPFPDPELTFAEAMILAKGKTPAGQKLHSIIEELTK
jgi:predicted DNA-binding transcriptional regulator YafY